MTKLLKLKDAAELLSVNTRTVERWCKSGQLEYFVLPCGKRVSEDQLNSFIRKLNPTVRIPTSSPDLARHGLA